MELSTSNNLENDVSTGDRKGAMLDLLVAAAAAVAAEKPLREDRTTVDLPSPANHKKRRFRTNRLRTISVKELQSLSGNQLINQFASLEGDEMKKTFTYQCRFVPMCSQRFYSFGSEDKARLHIKDHLLKHVQNLQPDFHVETPKKKKQPSPKKPTLKILKKTKPKIVESAIDNSPPEPEPEPERAPAIFVPFTPTVHSYFNCDEDHNYNGRSPVPYPQDSPPTETVIIDFNADQKTVILGETAHININDSNIIHQEVIDDWMPVVCHEEVVSTEQEVDVEPDINFIEIKQEVKEELETDFESSIVVRTESIPDWQLGKEKKPKGKAKFIGQSAAEKEMAMQMIKAVKRKQINSDKLECKICQPPRLFTAPTTLISHYRSHAGIKPYECAQCKAMFTRQHSLNYHLLIHLNQTRFTCEVCDRKFRHPSHFKEHQRRHTGESPFECADCSLRFKTRNTYKRHLKTRHGKVLTQTGGITLLSEEEFRRVRTCPRQRQVESLTNCDLDKENSRGQQLTKSRLSALHKEKDKTEPADAYHVFYPEDSRLTPNSVREIIEATNSIESQPTIMFLSPNNINYHPQKLQIS